MSEEKTGRKAYIDKLENDLRKASLAKRFTDSEDGKYLLEYIGELISSLTNKVLNTRRTEEEYIETRAQIEILRKLRQVLDVQSNPQVLANLRAQIDEAQSEE